MKTLVIKRNTVESRFKIENDVTVRLSVPNGIYVMIEKGIDTVGMIFADEWYIEEELTPITISLWERIKNAF